MRVYLEITTKTSEYLLIINYLAEVSASPSAALFWRNYSKGH